MAFSFFKKNDQSKEKQAEQNKQTVNKVIMVPVDAIVPNRFQPRKTFNESRIAELAGTIKDHGLLQPIVLREYEPHHYEIIAGERRFRAVKQLQWQEVPAIVQKMNDEETASMALVENLQREQLSPIEQAQAYAALMKLNDLTQECLAQQLGKSQSFVANKLRLLKLSEAAQEAIMDSEITERHGRALLALSDIQQQLALHKVLQDNLNVKETEELVDHLLHPEPVAQGMEAPAEMGDAPVPAQAPDEGNVSDKPTAAKPKTRKPISAHNTDPRVAINTIKKSVAMVREAGIPVTIQESDDAAGHHITITVATKEESAAKKSSKASASAENEA
ncbi:nucleoid occlusion protein [Schleiferilactobacillus perolens]|uniref:Nucleoid occlusion protein n=1 Tax=Schleiferilactobacillus perolens DSM 12744 TaxID=1423792 RepID=A0A0R1N8E0_9LACO|nr:nucleoid occlusion protein [Schleiferilactobacillus perolens DSM 12744]